MSDYRPVPIDTSAVKLPRELMRLREKLAENAHEVWSAGRLAEGWKFGAQRDDALKCHPCLIPYSQLSESEKDYDRRAAMETLRAILALGYEITPPVRTQKAASKKKAAAKKVAIKKRR